MTEQRIALEAFRKAGLDEVPAVAPLVGWLEASAYLNWVDLFGVVRSDHADDKETIMRTLWSSGDPVVRANVLRMLDPALNDEAAIRNKLVSALTGAQDTGILRAVLADGDLQILQKVARKRSLPVDLRREIDAILLIPPEA